MNSFINNKLKYLQQNQIQKKKKRNKYLKIKLIISNNPLKTYISKHFTDIGTGFKMDEIRTFGLQVRFLWDT